MPIGLDLKAARPLSKARAQALVAEGRLPMKEIAQVLGFSDLSSFSQAYKRWTGTTPSVARSGNT